VGSAQIRELRFSWNIAGSHLHPHWKEVVSADMQLLQCGTQPMERKLGVFCSCCASSETKVPDAFAGGVGQVTWNGNLLNHPGLGSRIYRLLANI